MKAMMPTMMMFVMILMVFLRVMPMIVMVTYGYTHVLGGGETGRRRKGAKASFATSVFRLVHVRCMFATQPSSFWAVLVSCIVASAVDSPVPQVNSAGSLWPPAVLARR